MPMLLQTGQAADLGLEAPVKFPQAVSESVLLPVPAQSRTAGLDTLGLNSLPLTDGVHELLVFAFDRLGPRCGG